MIGRTDGLVIMIVDESGFAIAWKRASAGTRQPPRKECLFWAMPGVFHSFIVRLPRTSREGLRICPSPEKTSPVSQD